MYIFNVEQYHHFPVVKYERGKEAFDTFSVRKHASMEVRKSNHSDIICDSVL